MDVVVWLRGLGLVRYEAIFRENDIDETVLPSLTHETLKELGVTAVGHRLKLLDAIAALRGDASQQTPSVTAAPARPSAATTTAAPVAEGGGSRHPDASTTHTGSTVPPFYSSDDPPVPSARHPR